MWLRFDLRSEMTQETLPFTHALWPSLLASLEAAFQSEGSWVPDA